MDADGDERGYAARQEVYVTDENRTKVFELMLKENPVHVDGYEGADPVLESTTYLYRDEIRDYELSLDTQSMVETITKPARLRDADRNISVINKMRASFLAIRRSREGFFVRASASPILRQFAGEEEHKAEKEKKKGFLGRFK